MAYNPFFSARGIKMAIGFLDLVPLTQLLKIFKLWMYNKKSRA